MIIIQSDKFDIIVKQNRNYKGDNVFTVIYGLQVNKHSSIGDAIEDFNNCLVHAAECEGYFE